jgi:hypothetical protein
MDALLEKTGQTTTTRKLDFMKNAAKSRATPYSPSRDQITARWVFGSIVSVIALVVLPFLIITPNTSSGLAVPLIVVTALIALPPLLIATIVKIKRYLKPGLNPRQRIVASAEMTPMLVLAVLFAIAVILMAWAAGADRNPTSYQVLTSASVLSYVILGGTPVVTYTIFIVSSFKKATVMTAVLGAASLLSIWFWAGYAVNMIGGSVW